MRKTVVLKHLLYFALIAGAAVLLTVSGIGCPFRRVTGIPCPACGTSRAVLSLLQGNISLSLYYHPLAVPLLLAVWAGLHQKKIPFLKHRAVTAFLFVTAGAVLLVYILRFPHIP